MFWGRDPVGPPQWRFSPLRWKINFFWIIPSSKKTLIKERLCWPAAAHNLDRKQHAVESKDQRLRGWRLARPNYCRSHWWPSQGTTEGPLLFLPGLKVSGIFGFVFPGLFVDNWHLWVFIWSLQCLSAGLCATLGDECGFDRLMDILF